MPRINDFEIPLTTISLLIHTDYRGPPTFKANNSNLYSGIKVFNAHKIKITAKESFILKGTERNQ